ncbi:MAG: DUF3365 domain-containing protein [Gallionella sp.]
MNDTQKQTVFGQFFSPYRAAAVAVLVWSATMGSFLAWYVIVAQEHTEQLARNEVRVIFNKDLSFRRWVTSHGGVYAPVTDKTYPNPGLSHIPERDIETSLGKKLTLMNPAYVMRQVMTDYSELYGGKGKLTSLKLINKDNAPDEWEQAALLRFEQGEREIAEFSEIDGQPYLRQIGALVAEKGCLKCHGYQGYKEGDVRGGITVAIPMQPHLDRMYGDIRKMLPPIVIIWLLGLALIALLVRQVRQRIRVQQAGEEALRHSSAEVARAHVDLTRFADVSAHHLIAPVRRLSSYTQLLRNELAAHPQALAESGVEQTLHYLESDADSLRVQLRDIQLYLAAGQPRGTVREEDANAVIAALERQLASRLAEQGAVIECEPLPPAVLDKPRLNDLFAVLVDNALIHARPLDHAQSLRISIGGERGEGLSRYRVADNGPGIRTEYRERVFEIFERLTAGDEGGSGIGLSIARRIVESRHGKIWIEQAEQGGTAVVFELPDGTPRNVAAFVNGA